MKRVALAALAAVAAACGLFGTAAPAQAEATHTIGVVTPTTMNVGESQVIRLGGTVAPPEEWWDLSYIEVVAVWANLISSCPSDAQSGAAVAENANGAILAIAMRPNVDANGFFNNTVGFTGAAPGKVLICAYLDNEVGFTYDYDWSFIEVAAPAGNADPGGGKSGKGGGKNPPLNLSPPRVKRRGNQVSCDPGVWTAASGRYGYRWLLDGRKTHATERKATIKPAARGHAVACRVTAYGPGGKATETSRALRIH